MLRTDVADRIDRRVAAAVPALPLFQTLLVYVVRKGLQGVVPNGFGSLPPAGLLERGELVARALAGPIAAASRAGR